MCHGSCSEEVHIQQVPLQVHARPLPILVENRYATSYRVVRDLLTTRHASGLFARWKGSAATVPACVAWGACLACWTIRLDARRNRLGTATPAIDERQSNVPAAFILRQVYWCHLCMCREQPGMLSRRNVMMWDGKDRVNAPERRSVCPL
jgi:hypothetical protein